MCGFALSGLSLMPLNSGSYIVEFILKLSWRNVVIDLVMLERKILKLTMGKTSYVIVLLEYLESMFCLICFLGYIIHVL